MKNYYFILGIHIYARESEIKRAYRKLALQFHPDKNPSPDAATIFREINEAYETLCDPQRKLVYDQQLKGINQTPASRGPFAHRDPRYRPRPAGFAPNRPTAKEEMIKLMQGYLPYSLFMSRLALACVFILFLDFVLPVKRHKEKVEGLYNVFGRYGQTGTELQTTEGTVYHLGKNITGRMRHHDTVVICRSPLLSVAKRVENESGEARNRIPASIYGNFIFFPGVWLITSVLGTWYNKGIEFRFNLGVVNFVLAILTLIMFLIS